MNDSAKPPASLLAAIAQDLRPVKASPTPFRLTLRVAPLALIVSSLILLLIGVRRDYHVLGPMLTWGASIVEFGLAILLVWIAAHEGTPAKRLPKDIVYLVTIATILVVAAISLLTFWTSPPMESARATPLAMGLACGIGSTIAGGILVGLFSWVYRKSLATRPTLAGALFGGGAGVAINAGWRLACPVSTPSHAFGAHGMAVLATVLLGAIIGRFLGGSNKSLPNSKERQ